ncbi:MAG TPA: copper transporter [Solirubrobacteraceae bacterium]|jgi:hypothetical protein
MFDYRYHAISLAAVLIALTLGILIGVAIGDSNLVSSAKSGIVSNLQSDLETARGQAASIAHEQQLEQAAQNDLYEIAVRDVLAGRKIGLVFFGSPSDPIDVMVREAVAQSGGQLTSVLAVREPLDLAAIAKAATGTQYTALGQTSGLLRQFGIRIGDQLIQGGQLLTRLRRQLLSSFDGQFGALDGLVVLRANPKSADPEQTKAINEFQTGMISSANALGIQTVGVELSGAEHSQVSWYTSQNMSSVDDLDKLTGRAALAFALAGAHGAWGSKPSADGLLPHQP